MQRNVRMFIGIVLVAVLAAWLAQPATLAIHIDFAGIKIDREIKIYEGLDLQGGMQVMLEADADPGVTITPEAMEAAKGIIENRINGLGVSEPLIQMQGDNRIIVELPGIKDPEAAIETFGQTGLLEFVDAGANYLEPGTVITTTGFVEPTESAASPTASPETTPAVTPGVDSTPTATSPVTGTTTAPTETLPPGTYRTIMTGQHLSSSEVGFDEYGRPEIRFKLTGEGGKIFGDHTTANVKRYLAITMDKEVISCPVINQPITQGEGVIEGSFTLDEAKNLVIQLKYGSLPVPLKVVENRTVGPTLGEDSVNKSLLAGVIGLGIVMVFMIVYYGVPGLLADIALLIYTAVMFALFKLIPVTLTVPGIAGFILSIGMAVDANILIFERTREELRAGKTLGAAVEAGFSRAWTSIRDSNFSTIITCVILFWFGMNYGASIIKGFALTLGIGVVISMFTAITVTRTFLRLVVGSSWAKDKRLFTGVESNALDAAAPERR